ncbi:hypothetical protein GDO78_020989 [Eleutherodactylus coqui]|uniref:Uncharacterized protein n=1 Tax=Eleutherodactylus coqui TaxID=57060 RepID=A0A8J6B011_ELECQ|nr:hypothetical protein GDO78_020989 [Eleutherodactylus coqui]
MGKNTRIDNPPKRGKSPEPTTPSVASLQGKGSSVLPPAALPLSDSGDRRSLPLPPSRRETADSGGNTHTVAPSRPPPDSETR